MSAAGDEEQGRVDAGAAVEQLMCEHRWVPSTGEGEPPRCASCDLGYAEYVGGTVRAALSRMGAWD